MSCGTPWNLWWVYVQPDHLEPTCRYVLQSVADLPGDLRVTTYLGYLGMTILLELPVFLVLRRLVAAARPTAVDVVILNLISHPLVVWILPRWMFGATFAAYLSTAELIAVTMEAGVLVLWGLRWRRASFLSLAANFFSWGAGGWVMALFFAEVGGR